MKEPNIEWIKALKALKDEIPADQFNNVLNGLGVDSNSFEDRIKGLERDIDNDRFDLPTIRNNIETRKREEMNEHNWNCYNGLTKCESEKIANYLAENYGMKIVWPSFCSRYGFSSQDFKDIIY